jgi:hypothetical protein
MVDLMNQLESRIIQLINRLNQLIKDLSFSENKLLKS